MLAHAHHYMQIATDALPGWTQLLRGRFTFTGDAHRLSVVNARRQLHREFSFDRDAPAAAAIGTFINDHRASAATVRTCRHHSEHAAQTGLSNLACAAAG